MAEVRRRLAELGHLSPVTSKTTAGPARIFRVPRFRVELSFISPMSDHHCDTCNRLRLTAAGQLRPCLLKALELDLKGPLRRGLYNQSLFHPFQEAIRFKDKGLSPLLGDTFPTMDSNTKLHTPVIAIPDKPGAKPGTPKQGKYALG